MPRCRSLDCDEAPLHPHSPFCGTHINAHARCVELIDERLYRDSSALGMSATFADGCDAWIEVGLWMGAERALQLMRESVTAEWALQWARSQHLNVVR